MTSYMSKYMDFSVRDPFKLTKSDSEVTKYLFKNKCCFFPPFLYSSKDPDGEKKHNSTTLSSKPAY